MTATQIRELRAPEPLTLQERATAREAARLMKEYDVGSILVCDGDELVGIVTDRDLAVRTLCEAKSDPRTRCLGEICSREVATLSPSDSTDQAVELMRKRAIRRIPVVEDGKLVGIVSLGDLALERDRHSVLGEISAALPNH
jgi:CBS domain-containing protein